MQRRTPSELPILLPTPERAFQRNFLPLNVLKPLKVCSNWQHISEERITG
jgi:hypothetical protein